MMKVHPLADMFPMLPDDELDELAADIKANGLLHPILLGEMADENGELGEVIVDGRNRFEACHRANVEPRFERLNGVDYAALILSANVARRHMTKGQRAMAVAMVHPKPAKTRRKGSGFLETEELGFSPALLSQARHVLALLPETAQAVVRGHKPLQEAFDEARKLEGDDRHQRSQLLKLRADRPDLAERVDAGLALDEAIAIARREAEERKQQRWAMTMNIIDSIRPLDRIPETAIEDVQLYDPALADSRGEKVSPARLRRAAEYLLSFADALEGNADEAKNV